MAAPRFAAGFMESGNASIDATFASGTKQPEFDMDVRLERVQLVELNDLLRATGGFDVAAGRFSFYSELAVQDGRVQGYVKPFFEGLDVYDRKQDKGKPIGKQAYEVVVGRRGLGAREPPVGPGGDPGRSVGPDRESRCAYVADRRPACCATPSGAPDAGLDALGGRAERSAPRVCTNDTPFSVLPARAGPTRRRRLRARNLLSSRSMRRSGRSATTTIAMTSGSPRGAQGGDSMPTKVRKEGAEDRRVRDAAPQARHAQERAQRADREEPQAGHRHRPVRGAREGREGSPQAVPASGVEPQEEEVGSEEDRHGIADRESLTSTTPCARATDQ